MMKKIAFIVVVAMCAFWSCNKESVNSPIEKIEFGFVPEDKSIIEKYDIKDDGIFVGVNNTCVTNVNQYPDYAKGKDLKYSSANPAIATIDGLGIVTGIAEGETFVYAESVDGSLKDSLKVYVRAILIEKVTISCKASSFDDHPEQQTDILFLNDTAVLSVVTEPLKASFANYVWKSSDPNVLEVDSNVVRAKGIGVATLTGNLEYKGTEDTKKVYTWRVEEAPLEKVNFTKRKNFIKIFPQENQPIGITFTPQYASNKSYIVEYYSKRPEIERVDTIPDPEGKFINKEGENCRLDTTIRHFEKKDLSIMISDGFLYVVGKKNLDTTYVLLKSIAGTDTITSDTTFFMTRRVE